ncbi:MAG: hypothetical protein V4507_15865 [Verrucomicrobiota bacterium]
MSDTHSCSDSCSGFGSFVKITVGILFFGLLTGLILCKYNANNKTYDQARAVERTKKLADLRAKEAVILENYAVVDESKGQYRIPISKAMELEVEALKNKPLHAAGVIPSK